MSSTGWKDLPMPTVACVEGYALGGGLELALACDLIFASETAHCGQPEGKLGFVAGWGGSWRLPRRIGVPAAKRLFFTGEILPAAEALRLGLVDLVATGRPLEEPLKAFDAQVLAGSAVAARQHKLLLASAFTATREEAGQYEAEASESCLVTDDTRARLDAFFAKRK
ncbi:MAG: enoyl-CoA hydratase/isomerase family protein [Lacunisphaera sp.]